MSEIDPIAYGALTQKVENLEAKIEKLEASIDTLIASEKLSEQEKIIREEKKKEMRRLTRLSLNITPEFIIRFNNMIEERERVIKLMNEFWIAMPTQIYKTNKSDEVDSLQPSIDEDIFEDIIEDIIDE
jgi:TolA-binding protein